MIYDFSESKESFDLFALFDNALYQVDLSRLEYPSLTLLAILETEMKIDSISVKQQENGEIKFSLTSGRENAIYIFNLKMKTKMRKKIDSFLSCFQKPRKIRPLLSFLGDEQSFEEERQNLSSKLRWTYFSFASGYSPSKIVKIHFQFPRLRKETEDFIEEENQ